MSEKCEMLEQGNVSCEECSICGSNKAQSSTRKMMIGTFLALVGLLVVTSKTSNDSNEDTHHQDGNEAVKKVEGDEESNEDAEKLPKPNNIFALDEQSIQ